MKDMMIDTMIAMMPYMKPVMWVGLVFVVIGLIIIASSLIFKLNLQKWIVWSVRIALATAVFFISAQIAGYFLNMPPTINFGDSSKFEFVLVSFWQIGTALLIASIVIKFLSKLQISKPSIA